MASSSYPSSSDRAGRPLPSVSTTTHTPPDARPVALVTGASSGLGREIARRLLADGFRTFGTSRSSSGTADGVEMTVLDVRDAASVDACVRDVVARGGRIDVLVNNAGVLAVGLHEEVPPDLARSVFETNYFGVVRMTSAVLAHMRPRRSGRIVQIGSLAGLVPTPGEAAYAASKGAIASHTDALRQEVAPFGIAVSLVQPGFFRTPIASSAQVSGATIPDYDALRSALRSAIDHSLEKGGDPAEVAALVSRVVAARRPRARYRVGSDAVWLPRMRQLMPERLFEFGLRRNFGIRMP